MLTTVAPVKRAILLTSPLSILRRPRQPDSNMYLEAVSSMPMVVMMTLAPASMILDILVLRTSHYFCLIFSRFLGSSTRT